ncbi:MAG: type B 50S ribosomal protein L31 [Neisseriaceae bacterium]|nr:type B 50S ribosomal protein L31 [Neisseriaceae bacterium]
MKPNIHPENYRTILFYDTGVQEGWLIRSCARTSETMMWTDGQEYPVFKLDTSSASHPAYTGKQREYADKGRVSQFNQRYQSILTHLKRD